MQQRYDYDVKALSIASGIPEMARALQSYGDEGWEVVAVIRAEELTEPSVLVFMKRPLLVTTQSP